MRDFESRCYSYLPPPFPRTDKANDDGRLKRAEQRIAELEEYCDNLLERIEALESCRQIGDFSG